ncbi:MAG: TIGR03085 family metal-binding protein [Actinomycetota bacterium]|nr:TIGR03085 family metal-binding protein [Actinomycetota bacterium]
MTSFARDERLALADLLDDFGPDAPTLCEGWTTRDLAAHLVLRERRPDAAPGIVVPGLSMWTRRVQDGVASRPYDETVHAIRTGPPRWSPFRLPGMDESANFIEYLVHHEDVRRAQQGWLPRPFDAGTEDAVWARLRGMARLLHRRVPVAMVLRRAGGDASGAPQEVRAGGKRGEVVVSGAPVELLLYSFGREEATDVTVEGDPAAVELARSARRGL